jgi:hypothetical protein
MYMIILLGTINTAMGKVTRHLPTFELLFRVENQLKRLDCAIQPGHANRKKVRKNQQRKVIFGLGNITSESAGRGHVLLWKPQRRRLAIGTKRVLALLLEVLGEGAFALADGRFVHLHAGMAVLKNHATMGRGFLTIFGQLGLVQRVHREGTCSRVRG